MCLRILLPIVCSACATGSLDFFGWIFSPAVNVLAEDERKLFFVRKHVVDRIGEFVERCCVTQVEQPFSFERSHGLLNRALHSLLGDTQQVDD